MGNSYWWVTTSREFMWSYTIFWDSYDFFCTSSTNDCLFMLNSISIALSPCNNTKTIPKLSQNCKFLIFVQVCTKKFINTNLCFIKYLKLISFFHSLCNKKFLILLLSIISLIHPLPDTSLDIFPVVSPTQLERCLYSILNAFVVYH